MPLKDILDAQELNDDQQLTVGDKTFTLGELRGHVRDYDSRLTTTTKERDALRANYDSLRGGADELIRSAARQTDDQLNNPPPEPVDHKVLLREALKPLLSGEDPADLVMQDKTFGAAFNKLREDITSNIGQELKTLREEFGKDRESYQNGLKLLTAAQVLEKEERWYDVHRNEIPANAEGNRPSLNEIRQFALQNQIVKNNNGYPWPDFDRALQVMTEPSRRQQEIDAEVEKRVNERMNQQRQEKGRVLPFMPGRGAAGAAGPKERPSGSARKILDKAVTDALNDPEVMNQ